MPSTTASNRMERNTSNEDRCRREPRDGDRVSGRELLGYQKS
jgi:hypothetical protein